MSGVRFETYAGAWAAWQQFQRDHPPWKPRTPEVQHAEWVIDRELHRLHPEPHPPASLPDAVFEDDPLLREPSPGVDPHYLDRSAS